MPLVTYSCSVNTYITDQHMFLHCGMWDHVGAWKVEATWSDLIYDMIYLSTAFGLTPGGNSTVHIYTKTMHGTTQITTEQHK